MSVRRDWGKMGTGLAFVSPWLIGFCVFTALPVGMSLYFSFCKYSVLGHARFIGMENYRELGNDPFFWNSLINTGKYAMLALPAGMLVSLGMALLLNREIRGQSIYRAIVFLPSLVPVAASSMVWLWLFNSRLGLINYALRAIGVEGTLRMAWLNNLLGFSGDDRIKDFALPPQWLSDARVAMPALALMSLWGVGHTVVIYLAGLQDVPKDLYEAAELDGATGARRMWHVTLPMISPVIFFNLIIAIIGTLQVFAIPYIMTAGGPARSTQFLTMYLFDNAFQFLRMGLASAMAWIQLVIILFLTAIAFWTSRRWVHYQGK